MPTDRGDYRWVRSISRPIRLANGATRWHVVLVDVDDHRQAQEALRENQRRFYQLAENVDEAFWLTSATLMPVTIESVRQLLTSGFLNSVSAA